jgi:hypothetical protein
MFCYYLGITPGIIATFYDDTVVYLGNMTTPSGIEPELNEYLMNVKTPSGGYIDGMAINDISLSSNDVEKGPKWRCRLDENPSACAHLVNHSISDDNVLAISFDWDDIILDNNNNQKRVQNNCTSSNHNDYGIFYSLPTIVRSDQTPRYIVSGTGETVTYNGDGPNCCVVFVAKHDIDQAGTELLLNYGLQPPYPTWAESWYSSSM